jgi:hypothetical protein
MRAAQLLFGSDSKQVAGHPTAAHPDCQGEYRPAGLAQMHFQEKYRATSLAFQAKREQKGACFFATFGTRIALGLRRRCP